MNAKQKLIELAKLNEQKKELESKIKELKKDINLETPVYIKFVNKIIKMATVKSERISFDTKNFKAQHPKLYAKFSKKQEITKIDIRPVKETKNGELIVSKQNI